MESIGQVADVERLKHRKVPRGRNAESSEGDAASEDFKKAASHAPDIQDEAVVDGADCFADGKSNREGEDDDGSKGMLYSDEDEDSLESNVGSDLLTNVEGQIDSLCNTRPILTGVEIVEDDATENVGMKNVAKLLRRKRYHDDDISQPATAPRISMSRCFRCLLPGHLARDCPNPAKQKPCASCAGYGHLQARCPKSFCFRCNGFGHVLADCHEDEAPKHGRVCVRCGKQECSASGGMDWFRVHRGCRELYSQSDLRHVRCFVCGQQGHFCCEDSPLEPAYPTCCLCGRKGHTGILDSCPDPLPPFLSAEANQAQRLREPSSRPQHARSGGYDRSGRPHDNNVGRQPRTGPMRLDTGRDGSGYHIRQSQHDSRRYLQCGRAAAEPAQLAMRAAAGDRYGPQRYGYSPADPPPGAQTSAHTESRQRRLHEAPPGQYRGHAHGDALHVAAAHPPPDVIAYGNRTVAGGRNDGGFRGQGDAHMQGGHTVMIQGAQPWQLQQHDISAQRYHPGSPGGQVQYQHTHAVQPQYVARSDATYYTSNANGQGTHRRWM